jgi:uncharacterized protein DUF4058
MKSPFPGMDPYIEACGLWEDFHDDLIGEIKRALAAGVPERYLVRSGERSYVELVEPAMESDSVTLRAFVATHHYRDSFVEFYETTPEQRLVTCVEVLSPSNKRAHFQRPLASISVPSPAPTPTFRSHCSR